MSCHPVHPVHPVKNLGSGHPVHPVKNRGSALLIVLGFLSFIVISAVSFAIYMRIEHQASSNYRHVIVARHHLETALCRAMDEVDQNLRNRKYPDDSSRWKGNGRVYTSRGSGNADSARPLSMEALGYLPPFLVNAARWYALTGPENNSGAKWQSISVPKAFLGFKEKGDIQEQEEIGRYAFVCVNVSDMLDVNGCRAALADLDSVTNRITLNHLFRGQEDKAPAFDQNMVEKDGRYETVRDFYACMEKRSDPVFGSPSPYEDFLDGVEDDPFNPGGAGGHGGKTAQHILVTDSIAKAEPRGPDACNLRLTTLKDEKGVDPAKRNNMKFKDFFNHGEKIKAALDKALGGAEYEESVAAGMIADYLDEDSLPQLNIPSVERVPMICRMGWKNSKMPNWMKVEKKTDGNGKDKKTIYSLKFIPREEFFIEMVYPFKPFLKEEEMKSFSLMVEANLHVDVKGEDPPLASWQNTKSGDGLTVCLKGELLGERPMLSEPYLYQPVGFGEATVDLPEGASSVRVSVNVLASLRNNKGVVDAVPCAAPNYEKFKTMVRDFSPGADSLYFQTASVELKEGGVPLSWDWQELWTPDARFNYRSGNWCKRVTATTSGPQRGVPAELQHFLSQPGLDKDVYLSVSDAGRFQSPGEWGFIVRPLSGQDAGMPNPGNDDKLSDSPEGTANAKNMFRTIRLYDQGGGRDKIYENFKYAGDDGDTLCGVRVNPLSDIDNVLKAALTAVPLDYGWAARLPLKEKGEQEKNNSQNGNDWIWEGKDPWFHVENPSGKDKANRESPFLKGASWEKFQAWALKGIKAARGRLGDFGGRMYEEYAKMDWHESPDLKGLSEADRKMLFSYTLDNFCDRQQLFLYFLAAEETMPTFSAKAKTRIKPVTGGRAVALVWRDPYPRRNAKGANISPEFHDQRVLFYRQFGS